MDEKQIALRQIAKGGGIIFIGYIILGSFDFLYKVLIARYLSPKDYGVLSLGLVILGVSVTISRLGFSQAFKKYLGAVEFLFFLIHNNSLLYFKLIFI